MLIFYISALFRRSSPLSPAISGRSGMGASVSRFISVAIRAAACWAAAASGHASATGTAAQRDTWKVGGLHRAVWPRPHRDTGALHQTHQVPPRRRPPSHPPRQHLPPSQGAARARPLRRHPPQRRHHARPPATRAPPRLLWGSPRAASPAAITNEAQGGMSSGGNPWGEHHSPYRTINAPRREHPRRRPPPAGAAPRPRGPRGTPSAAASPHPASHRQGAGRVAV